MLLHAALVAGTLSLLGEPPHKTLDLRSHSEPDGAEYSVCLCARPSPAASLNLPGHAFVGYSLLPVRGPRSYLALGHTTYASPGAALLTYTGLRTAVPGVLSEELFTAAQEHCLVLLVNKEEYEQALAAARDAASGQLPSFSRQRYTILNYTLGSQDCLGFALRVLQPFAARHQLAVPARGSAELPLPYLRRLIDAN